MTLELSKDIAPGPKLIAITCNRCGHTGFVSNRVRPSREVSCSRCSRSAILGDLKALQNA
jgi:ribosomal protein S27E